ncbi:SdiA-regulated domain-containing protein [Pseudomonas sp. 2FG]|uniref:SdiA-regulated domain-containing protein n=1 Tax=Pseudomonas sp. 2FG TaxID=2502191 RepID=UPI0010F456FF|nr:SdiA-regulated domain-containing protein [Pseudomonas sp. 2FG]
MNSRVELNPPRTKRLNSKTKLWILVLLAVAIVSVVATIKFRWHERLYFYVVSTQNAPAWVGKSIWLPDYKVYLDEKPIQGIGNDLSGLTYDYDKGRLLAITNAGPMQIVSLSKSGEVIDQYPLVGFEDTEGIAYMGNGLVVIVDERIQQLCFLRLPETPGPIDKKDAKFISLGINLGPSNKGFEGITYDTENDRLFVAKERGPRQLYEITGVRKSLEGNLQINIRDLTRL